MEGKRLEELEYMYVCDGARSKDPNRWDKDIALLEQAIKDNPNEKRNYFYMAETYKMMKNFIEAAKWYKKRTEFEAIDSEVKRSLLMLGRFSVHKEPK
jgi:tetratricopeptide (TPR) repeat protein